jgi:5-methyltetrahydrofolate--homocysteine methyltransferase
MNIKDYIKSNILVLDGAMGSLLQKRGLPAGEKSENWNITHSDIIVDIHKSYFDAGSNVVNTNTFGANIFNFSKDELDKIASAAVANARKAAEMSTSKKEKFVAFDIGPSGKMIKPMGDLDFEEAVSAFGYMASLAEKYGADLITVETFTDSYETKAALLGVKENCNLPVFVTNAYNNNDSLLTGASPEAMVAMLEGLGADAIGLNCSYGPEKLMGVVKRILAVSSLPVIFKPNAGLPVVIDGVTTYDLSPEDFSESVSNAVDLGVSIVGGCCGTTPEFISPLSQKVQNKQKKEITNKKLTVTSCNSHTVVFGKKPVIIGERINPTGKKLVKQALKENNIDYLINEGLEQIACGAHVLDVNCGLPEIDEPTVLKNVVTKLQAVCDLPLQIDTSDPVALEKAMRVYNGKPMINSVNGKKEVIDAVIPLVKKYGGLLVALTIDETGIPETAEGRFAVAEKILAEAKKYGFNENDLVFDPLCMTVSADDTAANVALETVKMITEKLHCNTVLGVSNVSFGLPDREKINSTFFTLAMFDGLSSAIINPKSKAMMDAYHSYLAVTGVDSSCLEYIDYCSSSEEVKKEKTTAKEETADDIRKFIVEGRGESAARLTEKYLSQIGAMEIINNFVIPALDEIGKKFEKKQVYLPQLLMSADAAKTCFDVVKANYQGTTGECKYTIVLATVKGDVHDIGKNIVKLLLENYGYNVIDLGKDVEPSLVLDNAIKYKAPLVGLSALMTTTVPAMEKTIALIHKELPSCKVCVGGAVLTEEYAKEIKADAYCADAMETVRYAESLL